MTNLEVFSPYTKPIVEEAVRRGIQVKDIAHINPRYAILELNEHREYIFQSRTDLVGQVTYQLLFAKDSSSYLLESFGYPVAKGILTKDRKEALGFLATYKTIVVKPNDNSAGAGITAGINNAKDLWVATKRARGKFNNPNKKVFLQEHIKGNDYRVLVIDYKYIFVAQRVPAYVVGDGSKNISKLIAHYNEANPDKHPIVKDTYTRNFLKRSGYLLSSIPANDEIVYLTDIVSVHKGAKVIDVTHKLTKERRAYYCELARKLGSRVVGIDVISEDIVKDNGKIIEINPHADITIHLTPDIGESHNPAIQIVDMLFPETTGINN
jgi:cyanophycin synthetase